MTKKFIKKNKSRKKKKYVPDIITQKEIDILLKTVSIFNKKVIPKKFQNMGLTEEEKEAIKREVKKVIKDKTVTEILKEY